MRQLGKGLTRRDLIKRALSGSAYIAPTILSAGIPSAVSAATPAPTPTLPPLLTADLSLTLSVDNASPTTGSTVTITVTLTNAGPAAATNVTATDKLPGGLTFVGAVPSQGTYNAATGLWSVGTLPPAASVANKGKVGAAAANTATLVIRATVTGASGMTNTATITHSDQTDPNGSNNSGSVTITPTAPGGPTADLAVTKTVDNATPTVGGNVTFTLTVKNNGPATATGVTVTDALPAGLTFVSANPNTAYNGGTGTWTIGTLANGAVATLGIVATATGAAGAPIVNTATVASATSDPVNTNNSASATVTPTAPGAPTADLMITKTVDNAAPVVGGNVTFTLTVKNNGPATATGVVVTDTLPAGLTFVSATPSGAYNSGTGAWTIGTLANGASATLGIVATATGAAGTPVVNTASVTSTVSDPASANNSASATVTPVAQSADLAVTKTVDNASPNNGDTVHFTVTVKNNGPSATTNVQVTDHLPLGSTFVGATPGVGTYDNTTGIWAIGSLANQATVVLTITATINIVGQLTNTARVTQSDLPDPVTSNNTANCVVIPQTADLALLKSISNATPNVADTITYTVTLINNGPNIATGVQVTDTLPSGVTFVSATPSQGTYNSATGVWTIGNVALNSPITLQIATLVTNTSAITNTAYISHSDQYDPNSGNNFATVGSNPNAADIAVLKTVDNARPNPGATITFTVTAINSGPKTATNVQVTDLLPADMVFVSATLSQGAYNNTTGVWAVGTLAVSAPATLQLKAIAPSNQSTNSASVTHSDQPDPNSSNDNANVTVTPPGADLMVGLSADKSAPKFGENVTITATVTNNGPDMATNVQVSDAVSGGLTFGSATPSQGTYNSGTGVWTVGSLASGATATLAITGAVATPNPFSTSAYVAHSDQFDPNNGNNSANLTVTPVQPTLTAALSQTSTCSANGVQYTESITSLSLTNGPANATLTVTLNYGGGDSNAFATPTTLGTFLTNASGAGTFTGSTTIPTTSAVSAYPSSVFVNVSIAPSTFVQGASATLTNGSTSTCSQALSLTATVGQSAFCGDFGLQYVENVAFTLMGGPASTNLTVRLDYTGGGLGASSPPSAFQATFGMFTTDSGGHASFNDQAVVNGSTSSSNYPTAVTVVVLNGATTVASFTATAGNGALTTGAASHC